MEEKIDAEDVGIQCTIWLKSANEEKWKGCLVLADGELTRAGKLLYENYKTLNDVKNLIEKRVIWSVKKSADGINKEDGEFFSECGDSLMKMQAKERGDYCYIFDEKTNMWYFGVKMKQRLADLLKFIFRNQ